MVLAVCLCQQGGGLDRPVHCSQGKAFLGAVGQTMDLDIFSFVRSAPVPGALFLDLHRWSDSGVTGHKDV